MIKKRRIEIIFVFVLVISVYMVIFSGTNMLWKISFAILYMLIILTSIVSLVLENRTAQQTLLWIYVLILFPILGYSFYLFSGQLYIKGYLFKNKRMNDRDDWQRLAKRGDDLDLSFLKRSHQVFGQYGQNAALTRMDQATQTTILKDGSETFSEIKQQLLNASYYIHMEYYMFRSDRLGKEIMEILIEKAKAGIEVRFIYDAGGSISLTRSDVRKMTEAGVFVCPFSPIKYGFFNQKFNFRNHRKIIVIDGRIGFVGGLNVGIEYLGEDERFGFWRDTHLLLEGEAVQTLHAVFLLDWKYVSKEDLFQDKYMKSHPVANDGIVHIVASGPDTQENIISNLYFTMITCATKSIWIATPYFIPPESFRTALKIASKRGIQVRVMVPEINDGFFTQYATRSYFPELLRNGIEVYSYKKGFSHQKIMIIDGNLASIGTANMDMRSFNLNFEVNAFLIGGNSIRDLVKNYVSDMKDCELVKPVSFYKRSLLEKLKESFARLFSGVL